MTATQRFLEDNQEKRQVLQESLKIAAEQLKSGILKIDSNGIIWRLKKKVGGNQGPRLVDVESVQAGKLMPNGRLQLQVYQDGKRYVCSTSRLIWYINNGNIPAGHHIHHINGKQADDRLENLECLNGKDHISNHYEKTGRNISYADKCRETQRLYRDGLNKAQVARATGVSFQTARRRLQYRETTCVD